MPSAPLELADELQRLRARHEAEAIRSRSLQSDLDEATRAVKELESRLESEAQRARDLTAALAAEAETREIYQRQVEGFYRSRSWRITRPLRAATAWVRSTPAALGLARSLAAMLRRLKAALEGRSAPASGTTEAAEANPASVRSPPEPPAEGVETASRLPAERALVDVLARIAAHTARSGPLSHVFALPFLANGGAEQNLASICRSLGTLCESRSQALFLTDLQIPATPAELPGNVLVIDLLSLLPASSLEQRKHFLMTALRTLRPAVFHCINSDIGWRVITEKGMALRHITRIVGSMFAFQFSAETGDRIGYAQTYLAAAYPHLHLLLSDNERFIRDAAAAFRLEGHREKCRVVYSVPRNYSAELVQSTVARLTERMQHEPRTQPRMRVLWAGRLDEEKRIDLLPAIAAACPQMDFEIFGKPVVGDGLEFPHPPANLLFRGPFASPEDVLKESFDAFIFTSRWEGLPNILLEVGLHGVPCVAPTVGGVGELISEETGYPLRERPEAADYRSALERIEQDPVEAARRALRLISLITTRHSPAHFEHSLKSLADYLPA